MACFCFWGEAWLGLMSQTHDKASKVATQSSATNANNGKIDKMYFTGQDGHGICDSHNRQRVGGASRSDHNARLVQKKEGTGPVSGVLPCLVEWRDGSQNMSIVGLDTDAASERDWKGMTARSE
eukprot:2023108-Amphidinium_carterae.1